MCEMTGKRVWLVMGRPLDAADTDVLFVASTPEKACTVVERAQKRSYWGEVWIETFTVDSFLVEE